jgi:endonuclease YncB( thermonuclease family)
MNVHATKRAHTLFAILLFATAPAQAQDADTIKLDGTSYRLDGVDAPEPDQNCMDAEGQLYPCGRAAIEALKKFVGSHRIYCEDLGPDQGRYKKGRKERRVGCCSADGTDLSRWLVQNGWAINFEPHAKGRFKPDEDEAREGRFGMWRASLRREIFAAGAGVPPSYWDRVACRRARQAFSRSC